MKAGASDPEILAAFRRFFADRGRSPQSQDFGGTRLPTLSLTRKRFGGIEAACRAAGIPFTRKQSGCFGQRMPWPTAYFGIQAETILARKEDIYE